MHVWIVRTCAQLCAGICEGAHTRVCAYTCRGQRSTSGIVHQVPLTSFDFVVVVVMESAFANLLS